MGGINICKSWYNLAKLSTFQMQIYTAEKENDKDRLSRMLQANLHDKKKRGQIVLPTIQEYNGGKFFPWLTIIEVHATNSIIKN